MKDIRRIVAANIAALRKNAGYTQAALAEKLQYSDKAVSKWESGASLPDAGVLMSIASLFGVTVDYLLQEEHAEEKLPAASDVCRRHPDYFSFGGGAGLADRHGSICVFNFFLR